MSWHQITAAAAKSEVNAAASCAVCGDGEQHMVHFQSATSHKLPEAANIRSLCTFELLRSPRTSLNLS